MDIFGVSSPDFIRFALLFSLFRIWNVSIMRNFSLSSSFHDIWSLSFILHTRLWLGWLLGNTYLIYLQLEKVILLNEFAEDVSICLSWDTLYKLKRWNCVSERERERWNYHHPFWVQCKTKVSPTHPIPSIFLLASTMSYQQDPLSNSILCEDFFFFLGHHYFFYFFI